MGCVEEHGCAVDQPKRTSIDDLANIQPTPPCRTDEGRKWHLLGFRAILRTMPSIRRLGGHEWPAYRDLRLRALGESPDAFGSTLEQERERPDVEWAARVSSSASSELDLPLVVVEEAQVIGLAWGKILASALDTAHVFQMWVAPECRGQGQGAELLATIIGWSREANARRVVLSVAFGNSPAQRLYARAGFKALGDPESIRPGSTSLSQPMYLEL